MSSPLENEKARTEGIGSGLFLALCSEGAATRERSRVCAQGTREENTTEPLPSVVAGA